MALRTGVGSFLEQDRANGEGPRRVYFIETSPGVYTAATGSIGEADAYLIETSAGVFTLTDTASEEDRVAYLVDTSKVIL